MLGSGFHSVAAIAVTPIVINKAAAKKTLKNFFIISVLSQMFLVLQSDFFHVHWNHTSPDYNFYLLLLYKPFERHFGDNFSQFFIFINLK